MASSDEETTPSSICSFGPVPFGQLQTLEGAASAQVTRQFAGRYLLKVLKTKPPHRWKYLVTVWDAKEEVAFAGRLQNAHVDLDKVFRDYLLYRLKRWEVCDGHTTRRLDRARDALERIFEAQPGLRGWLKKQTPGELSDSEEEEEEWFALE